MVRRRGQLPHVWSSSSSSCITLRSSGQSTARVHFADSWVQLIWFRAGSTALGLGSKQVHLLARAKSGSTHRFRVEHVTRYHGSQS